MNSLSNVNAGQAQPCKPQSVIDDRVSRLQNVIAELGDLVSATIQRLDPIIVPYPTEMNTNKISSPPRPVQCAHAGLLEDMADQVERITASLRGALSNAQI